MSIENSKFLILPRYRIFLLAFLFTLRYYPPPPRFPSIPPSHQFLFSFSSFMPCRSLSQTKQSRTRCDSPYVRLLGDNLYTRPPIITYSLDTSSWHESVERFALPRFSPLVKKKFAFCKCRLSRPNFLTFLSAEKLFCLQRTKYILRTGLFLLFIFLKIQSINITDKNN